MCFFTPAAALWERNSDELCDHFENDDHIIACDFAVTVCISIDLTLLFDNCFVILCDKACDYPHENHVFTWELLGVCVGMSFSPILFVSTQVFAFN